VCLPLYLSTSLTPPPHTHTHTVHRAFDLALATSYIFAGTYPTFQEVCI
jgi:hypothetical protein